MGQAVSHTIIQRLPVYLDRVLEFQEAGALLVSSAQLAARCGVSSARVRDDLGSVGLLARQRRGYAVPELAEGLRRVLGMRTGLRVMVLGGEGFGQALAESSLFSRCGMTLTAVLPPPYTLAQLTTQRAQLAVLSAPGAATAETLALLSESGVTGVWNLTGRELSPVLPPRLRVENFHLADSLLCLAGRLTDRLVSLENRALIE